MKVLLGILLVAIPAFAFPTPEAGVPPECIDPTFACQDLQSAKLCRVVSTCIHDVWETMSVPDSNDEVCDICKEMVKEARDQLLSNMTQEEIKEVFEGSCKLLPIKIIAEGCIKIVDEIIPQLVEMLASRMDPTMVCTVSGMCFPSKKDMEVEKHILKFVRDHLLGQKVDQCAECTQMMTDVQTFMKSSSEAECKDYVEKLCHEKMPSYLCNIVLNTYFNDIYNFILNTKPAVMCSSVGICPQKCELKNEAMVAKVEDELTCEFCEHLLQHVKDLITSNTTLDEFKTAMLNFCKKTGKWADKCTSLVNNYYDMIFTYIKQLDTKGMCTLMGLCDNTGCVKVPLVKIVPGREAHRRIPLIKLQPAQPILRPQPLVRLIPAEMISKKQTKDSNDVFQLPLERLTLPLAVFEKDAECALCRAFSFYLEKDLEGDNSKLGVRQAINGVCEKWMVEYPDHCKYLIQTYSLKMRMAIAKGISFDGLCTEVKACPLEENKKDELNVKVIPKVRETPFCDLCKDAMNEVEKVLSDPATKQKLKDTLDQGCNILPQALRDDCTSFVNQNIDALIDILEQELQPDQICPALKLCGSQKMIGVPPRVKDLECDVCKDVISSFRGKIQDPDSKKIVLTFLEEGCMRLPSSVAGECRKFVDDNIDLVIKMIVEEMDPQKVCAMLSICPASIHVQQPKETVNGVECELCKEVISKVENIIKDPRTEAEIKAALDKVCDLLPSSLSGKCESFVTLYTDLIVSLMVQELDPQQVCVLLGLCQASVHVQQPKETVNDVECELCKEVISKVENIIKDQKTEAEIKAALDKVCDLLPSSLSGKCESFVNLYTDLIVSLLVEGLNPQQVCERLGLCKASDLVKQPKETLKDVECDLCEQVIGKLEDMVKDKRTEDEIKAALETVCSYLPSSLSAKCKNFVDQYTELIVTLLMQELDPQMVCAQLGLCKAQIKEEKPKELKGLECDLCKEVVTKIDDMVKDNRTEEEVLKALDKVCSYMPSSIATECESLVNQYALYLMTFISQGLSPGLVCAAAEICPKEPGILQLKSKVDGVECEACQYSLHFIKDELMNNETEGRVKVYLKELCGLFLPITLSGNCKAFVDEYGDSLLLLIAQEIDPTNMCYKTSMCKSNATIPQLLADVTVPNLSHFQIDECSVCTTVVDYVDKLLEEDDVDKEITHLVEKVCVVLPSSFRDKCSSMLDVYGPYILQMIGQVANSKELCQDIDLCARPAGRVHLIGGAKCTFGPSYWCHSPAHAAACKAESYCQSKVWTK